MDKLRKFRVYILAAALILVWVLVALLSRCGRAEAVTDGRDGVVVCDTMPRLCPTDTSWKDALLFPVKKIEPNKPPNAE
jgi:hypothetical protein